MNKHALFSLALLLSGCPRSPVSVDTRSDLPPAFQPSQLDLLVVLSVSIDSVSFRDAVSNRMVELITHLRSPTFGSGVKDFHLGVVSSKIAQQHVCQVNLAEPPADGTFIKSNSWPAEIPHGWPAGWPWPPPWSYLSNEQVPGFESGRLINGYLYRASEQISACSVTQFVTAATLALDGRNLGFLREDSLLVVLLFADQEDCSTAQEELWNLDLLKQRLMVPGDVCYEPSPGLLQPVAHMMNNLLRSHPAGMTLVAVFGTEAEPTWTTTSLGGRYVDLHCGKVKPTRRLPELMRQIEVAGHPRVHSMFVDACGYEQSDILRPVAERILELIQR